MLKPQCRHLCITLIRGMVKVCAVKSRVGRSPHINTVRHIVDTSSIFHIDHDDVITLVLHTGKCHGRCIEQFLVEILGTHYLRGFGRWLVGKQLVHHHGKHAGEAEEYECIDNIEQGIGIGDLTRGLGGQSFEVVASDGRPMATPQVATEWEIGPGERYDVVLQAGKPGVSTATVDYLDDYSGAVLGTAKTKVQIT